MLQPTSTSATTHETPQRAWAVVSYWALQALGWGFYFRAQASGEVIFADASWSQATRMWGVFCLCGIGLTHLLRWIIRSRGWLSLSPKALLIRLSLATVLLASLLDAATVVLAAWQYNTTVAPIYGAFYRRLPHDSQQINQGIATLVVSLLWVGLYMTFALQRYRYRVQLQQRELSAALQAAELRLLKAQLNPHFLFNALNAVRSLIGDAPAQAQDAVTQLARTMRYALASGDQELVTLARELEMVEDYLAIESLRLAERLKIDRDIAPETSAVLVPVMLLQTLVENAIKHGIAQLKQGGTLRIETRVVDQHLIVRIVNPYPERVVTAPAGEGTGLRNSVERLRLLFGDRSSLRLDLSHAGIAIAEMRVPV